MAEFCPSCGNLLLLKKDINGFRFFCESCAYIFEIVTPIEKKIGFSRKKIDDILGGVEGWKHVDQTQSKCPKCNHNMAYFMQIQTRSADEPMTIFYKCVQCGWQWKEN